MAYAVRSDETGVAAAVDGPRSVAGLTRQQVLAELRRRGWRVM